MVAENLVSIGIIVILIGFVLVLAGTILQGGKTRTEAGGIIFIGPIPIIGATSKNMFYAVIALSLIMLVVFLLMNKKLFI